jgi:predicted extracellular nuclease
MTDPTVTGDLNASALQDPLNLTEGAGYTDLVGRRIGARAY